MATQQMPPSGITLHGAPNISNKDKGNSAIARSAVLLRLNEQVIADLKTCSDTGRVLQLLSGKAPKLRIGTKMTDLLVTPETYRHELYVSDNKSSNDLSFTAFVTQQASLKIIERKTEDTAGADAALANLKQSLASFAQDKEAKQATIASTIIPAGKSKHLHPNRSLLDHTKHQSRINSPMHDSSLTPRVGPIPTSSPLSDTQERAKTKIMRRVLGHYLARGSASNEEIAEATKIDSKSRNQLLSSIAQCTDDSKWALSDRIYKELDIWAFPYKTEQDRKTAVDGAIRAFDRQRLSKDDKLWQMLLPKEERGKGKVLSRLHSRTTGPATKPASSLPSTSPLQGKDGASESKQVEGKLTPKPAAGSTPRSGAAGNGKAGMSIERRLKESKKLREAEEAKVAKAQKKTEQDATASDRESKQKPRADSKLGNKVQSAKIKSAEVVHSSDDDDEGSTHRDATVMKVAKSTRPAATSVSSLDRKSISQASKAVTPRARETNTPSHRVEKPRTAPLSKHQLSPAKVDTKPRVPSPLSSQSTSKKRPLESSDEAGRPRKISKLTSNGPSTAKPVVKGVAQVSRPAVNGTTPRNTDGALKRKANDISTSIHDHDLTYDPKHQRTESSSSRSVANGSSLATSTARTSIASPAHSPAWQRSPSRGSSSSEGVKLSWERAIEEAEKFKSLYYPAYTELYNRLDALPIGEVKAEDRRKLYEMHERLRQMKKEIASASPPGSSS